MFKRLFILFIIFGIVGCEDALTFFKDKNIILSCSCIEFKSTDNQCNYSSDVPLVINEEAGILSFNHSTYGSLSIQPSAYIARNDYNLLKFNRSSLQITHSRDERTRGGIAADVYQCHKMLKKY